MLQCRILLGKAKRERGAAWRKWKEVKVKEKEREKEDGRYSVLNGRAVCIYEEPNMNFWLVFGNIITWVYAVCYFYYLNVSVNKI
jgi:hypothetical protein